MTYSAVQCELNGLHGRAYAPSAKTSPRSIRDSIWRAELVMEELISSHGLDANTDVLVVGFGPAGIACCVELMRRGIPVTILESPYPGWTQPLANCTSRDVCPTTFDFPSDHWPIAKYPFDGSPPVLPWEAGTPEEVHTQLRTAFDFVREQSTSRVRVFQNAEWKECEPETASLACHIVASDGTDHRLSFKLVIICNGPGPGQSVVRVKSGVFANHSYWSNGIRGAAEWVRNRRTQIVIFGGQDGGLGEFVRICTRNPNPRQVLKAIPFSKAELATIQDLNRRMWASWVASAHDHSLCCVLQEESEDLADQLWTRAPIKDAVTRLLGPSSERPIVQLAMKCYHFGLSYWGNRVVAQLLARGLAEHNCAPNGRISPLRFGVSLDDIQGIGHHCKGSLEECDRFRHRVVFTASGCPGGAMTTARLSRLCETGPDRSCEVAMGTDSTSPIECDLLYPRFGPGERIDEQHRPHLFPANVVKAMNQMPGTPHVPAFYTLGPK